MNPSQPILRRSRRIKPVNPRLSHFVDARQDPLATEKQSPALEPILLPAPATNALEPLHQVQRPASLLPYSGLVVDTLLGTNPGNVQTGDISEPLNYLSNTPEESFASPPVDIDTALLASATPIEPILDRWSHNPITYRRQRTLRIRSTPKDPDVLRSTQQSFRADTPASTPSCSPFPVKPRKRRRRLPPLKNRLAKAARARLRSQETLSQPSVSAPLDPDDDYAPPVVEPNVAQRRLVAPQNYTIPDLKDLLNSKPQAHVDQAHARPVEPQRNPLPQFVLPPVDGVHVLRLRSELKSVRTRRRDVGPRLNFVPLEAHQEQATARPSERRMNPVVQTQALPLVGRSSPRGTQAYSSRVVAPVAIASPTRAPLANDSSPSRSPCRILVKSTPEPEEPTFSTPQHIPEGSHRAQAPTQRIHLPDSTSSRCLEAIPTQTTRPRFTPPPSRALAPMSDLLDNLVKLAKSAVEMGRPVSPSPMRPSLKRARQTTLTKNGSVAQLVFESAEPSKVRKLN